MCPVCRVLDDLQANHKKRPTDTTCSQQQAFYPRTANLTDIIFTREEQELLDLDAQYSSSKPASCKLDT